ncbi:MAG: NADH-quinone oxidoreductase subunit NuoE [Myxococcales bacterium]|jgi:NADH-quinone oxidoreductase subunit E
MPVPFTEEQQRRFDEELARVLTRYPADRKSAALLPVLRLAQQILGWLPHEALEHVAARLEVPACRAREVAAFYVMMRPEPLGRHVVEVCTNLSCSLRGAERVLEYIEQRLGVRAGQTTSDKRVTLREAECLASCGTGPCLQVDEEHMENLTPETIDKVLARLD